MHPEWTDFEKFVFDQFQRLFDEISDLKESRAELNVKASLWGGLAGLVPIVLWLVIEHLR